MTSFRMVRLLATLADGTLDARLTRAAGKALERLGGRTGNEGSARVSRI